MLSDPEELAVATKRLGQVLAGDRSSAESLEPTLVQRLLDISTNGYRGDIKRRAIAMLCQASFNKCRSLMENEVIPLLVKFVSDDYIQSVTEALIALIRLACAFPHCIEVISRNHALEAVQTIVSSDRCVHEFISYSAKFVAVICCNYNLPTEKVICWLLFQEPNPFLNISKLLAGKGSS